MMVRHYGRRLGISNFDKIVAYETAFKSMTTIQNRTSIMPQQIQQAVQIVFSGTSAEVSAYVPDLIE
jgi:hypothetical protein